MRRMQAAIGALSLFIGIASAGTISDPVASVDPGIGSDLFGRVFVGASVPFGMVKVGPDMVSFSGRKSKSGYAISGRILGFSHLHLSGAAGKYGNIRVMPASGPLDMNALAEARDEEITHPDYYAATLQRDDIRAELTATSNAALHRYSFRKSEPAHITVRLDRFLVKSDKNPEGQRFLGGTLRLRSRHEIDGVGRYIGGWNMGGEYRVYFAMIANQDAATVRGWTKAGYTATRDIRVTGDAPLAATFDYAGKIGRTVTLRVGISFVSIAKARQNADAAPEFDTARAATHAAWENMLGRMEFSGVAPEERRQLYTALYHGMLMPSDRSGENPGWTSAEPYYDDYYAIWDSYRTTQPLLTLIAPERVRDMMRSLVDIYRHEGWLPDARSGNSTGRTQGGSNADVAIADAYLKGIRGVDYATALKGMLKDATVVPDRPRQEGRGGLKDYLEKGWIGSDTERAGSRQMEYSYDDFAIAELACGLGRRDLARHYARRSENWTNLWDKDLTQEGVTGFLRPRHPDGSWAAPYTKPRGTWPDFLYEGNVWTYSVDVPHDVARLIALAGGKAAFIRRLDALFTHMHFDMSNQPGFLIPMLYHWAGRPDLSADWIDFLRTRGFNAGRGGLPGPDDGGSMSAWYVWQAIGIYPVAGQDVYLIGTPSVGRTTIRLGPDRTLTIEAIRKSSPALDRYVQSATLNGKPLNRAWFRHGEIAGGGILRLVMGPAPSAWGATTPPPSLSDAPGMCP